MGWGDFVDDTVGSVTGAVSDAAGSFKGFLSDAEDDVKEKLKDFDQHIIQPIKNNPWEGIGDAFAGFGKGISGEWAASGLRSSGAISNNAYDEMVTTQKAVGAIGAAVGGVVAAPFTGGASLGITYGALSGVGMGLAAGETDIGKLATMGGQGAVMGAVGGAAGKLVSVGANALAGSAGTFGEMGMKAGTYLSSNADTLNAAASYGIAGGGGAYAATGDMKTAAMFGLGSAVGAGAATAQGAGTFGVMAGAGAGGFGMLAAGGGAPESGGGGGGGNYALPGGSDPNAGTSSQKKATRSVPEAEFLDGGGGRWGNSGIEGFFAGLDDLHNKDEYVDLDKIRNQYSRRKSGEFVNR